RGAARKHATAKPSIIATVIATKELRWTVAGARGYNAMLDAPVAQLDRVLVSEAKGHRFESCRARHQTRRASPFFRASRRIRRCRRSRTRRGRLTVCTARHPR